MAAHGKMPTLKLANVAYHPGIYKNLLSHARLLKSGYNVLRQDAKAAVYAHKSTGHTLQFKMKNNLYVLEGSMPPSVAPTVNATTVTTPTRPTSEDKRPKKKTKATAPSAIPYDSLLWEWHRKLNHADFRLVAQVIAPLDDPKLDRLITGRVCPDCAQG